MKVYKILLYTYCMLFSFESVKLISNFYPPKTGF